MRLGASAGGMSGVLNDRRECGVDPVVTVTVVPEEGWRRWWSGAVAKAATVPGGGGGGGGAYPTAWLVLAGLVRLCPSLLVARGLGRGEVQQCGMVRYGMVHGIPHDIVSPRGALAKSVKSLL